jgi:hypothetical protein
MFILADEYSQIFGHSLARPGFEKFLGPPMDNSSGFRAMNEILHPYHGGVRHWAPRQCELVARAGGNTQVEAAAC